MIEYRKASFDDIHLLAELRVAMLCEETEYSEDFRKVLRDNTMEYIHHGLGSNDYLSWVAVQEGVIIAMGGINFFALPPNDWCPSGKTAYLGNMYTLPAFRRQGIAAHLLALLIDEAKDRQCERILLNTTDMGRPLYKKLGFADSPTAMALFPFGIISQV